MKKIIAIITIFTLLFSLCVPVFGATANEDHARVLELIKKRLPNSNLFDEFDSSSYKSGGKISYDFYWYNSDDKENFTSMQATVSESGFITSYYYNDSSKETYSSKPTIKKIDTDYAMEKCALLVEKLNPALIGIFTLSPNNTYDLNSRTHRFIVQRTENGIPVYGDTGFVTVDENADTILSFNMNYTEGITFPDFQNTISKEDAQKAFAEKIGMTLLYETEYLQGEPAPFVAYKVDASNTYINALSGETVNPVNPKYDIYLNNKNESLMQDSATGGAKPEFSEAELKELEKIAGLLNEDDACKMIKNDTALSVDKNASLTSSSLYSNGKDKYFYNMRFETDESEYINVTFDAKTGEVQSFNRSYSDYKNYEGKKADEALAKKYVAQLAPKYYSVDDCGKYRFEKCESNTFSFVRYENDIPFFYDKIQIRIAPDNGEILSYSVSHTDANFSYPDSILSRADACVKLFGQIDYDLFYYPACTKEDMEFCDTSYLLYMLDEEKNPTIKADSGNLAFDYESEKMGEYTDISGHWAESIINELAKYSIGFSENEFRPDDVIVQKDFVALLCAICAGYYPGIIGKNYNYTSAYDNAENMNIIKEGEKAPEEAVTREKAAIYMVRAIDLEKVAELDGIYRSLYEDVTENIGYISILTGMKIVSGYNGCFNPQREITRAEAMVMIYNYLSN